MIESNIMDTLPDELICIILSFCDPITLFRFSNVSNKFMKYRKMFGFRKKFISNTCYSIYTCHEYDGIFYIKYYCYEFRIIYRLNNKLHTVSIEYNTTDSKKRMAIVFLDIFFKGHSNYINHIIKHQHVHVSRKNNTELYLAYITSDLDLKVLYMGDNRKVKWQRCFRVTKSEYIMCSYLDKNGIFYLHDMNKICIFSDKGVKRYTLDMSGFCFGKSIKVFKNILHISVYSVCESPYLKIFTINLDTERTDVFSYVGSRILFFEGGTALIRKKNIFYTILDLTTMKSVSKFYNISLNFPVIDENGIVYTISNRGTINSYS